MDSPSRRADSGWQRPGMKALEALSLGIYNNRSRAATNIFKAKKSFQHTINTFEPISEENLRFNPDPQYLLESLKICMMRLGPSEQIPLHHNYAVNILLETFQGALHNQKAAKVEAEEAKKHLEEKEEAWSILEADYKRELKNLEVLLAGISRGSDHPTLTRTNSLLRERRGELSKATSNVESAIANDNVGEDGETHHERKLATEAPSTHLIDHDQKKDSRHSTSNLSGVITDEKAKKNGFKRRDMSASNQVFDHKRVSIPPHDKLCADFGTIMDSEFSKTIQQDQDALAAASRDRWLKARRRAGHTGGSSPCGSSPCGSSEGRGLGLTLYDRPPMQPSYHAPFPTPIIVEPEGDVNGHIEGDDDEGEEVIKLPHAGYSVKSPKKSGARARAKTLFGMGMRMALEMQQSDSSSPMSSDSDDISPGGIANAIANANFIATIASPMIGTDKTTPPHKTRTLRPSKHTFKKKKKTSYGHLPAMVQHFMHGRQKHGFKDTAYTTRSKRSMRPNTKYDKSAADFDNIMHSERGAFSESPGQSTNSPPLSPGQRGNGNPFNGMEAQASPKFALDLPSQEALVEYTTRALESSKSRDKAPMAQQEASNLRHEHILEDDNGSDVPKYNRSNIRRETFKGRKTDTEPFPPFAPRTSSSLGLEKQTEGQGQGLQSEQQFLHPYAESRIVAADAISIVSDRVYDPRIVRKPSPLPFSYAEAVTRERDQQHKTPGQRALVDRVRSTKEERDVAEIASRRVLLRASGHQSHGDETASWERGQPRHKTFGESVVRRQSEASIAVDRSSSKVSVVTALYDPRDSVAWDDGNDGLIRARSERGRVSDADALARLTGNVGSSRNRRGPPPEGAEHNTMPYSLSAEALLTVRERNESVRQTPRQRGSVSSIASLSTTASSKTRGSARGVENFMISLRNVMKSSKSKHVGKAEGSLLADSKSPTNLGEVNAKGFARGYAVANTHDPFIDPVDNSFISLASGEGAHPSDKLFIILHKTRNSTKGHESFDARCRPVTAIFQGPDTSKARRFSFAPADERQFSTDGTLLEHHNQKEKEMPARSLRHSFGGSEDSTHSITRSPDSLEITRHKAPDPELEDHGMHQPGSSLAGDWREGISHESVESADSDDNDTPEPLITYTELSDTAAHNHEASRKEVASDGYHFRGTAPTTAFIHKKRGELLQPPKMAGLQNEQTSLRRGGSGQYGRSGSRLPSSQSVASMRKRMIKRQASREHAKPQKSPLESAKVMGKKPSHEHLVRTSSRGSIIAFFEQKVPQQASPPPLQDEIDLKRRDREGSGQLGRDSRKRLSSGPRSAGFGQRQAGDDKVAGAKAPVNAALAAAKSVAEAAARKKLAEEAEKKKLAEEPGKKKNKK